MAVRRWVVPCVLGLCASTAAALQDGAAARPTADKRALLVLPGVLRQFNATWKLLEELLVVPNERMGYRFTIVLHTSMQCSCGHEPEPITQLASDEQRLALLQEIVGHRDVTYVDSLGSCYLLPNKSFTHSYFADSRHVHCGALHFAWRSVQGLDHMGDLQQWSKIIAIRPDVVLESRLLLDSVCSTYPGVNVITGDCQRKCHGMHWNDIDMAWLLCDGRESDVFKGALSAFGESCPGESCEEGHLRLPPDFHPQEWVGKRIRTEPREWGCHNDKVQMCRTVQLLAQRGIRFGTLEAANILVRKNQPKDGKCRCR